jgi:hypothetical protein
MFLLQVVPFAVERIPLATSTYLAKTGRKLALITTGTTLNVIAKIIAKILRLSQIMGVKQAQLIAECSCAQNLVAVGDHILCPHGSNHKRV